MHFSTKNARLLNLFIKRAILFFFSGLVIGGKDLKFESSRMGSCNIIICTPGRLLQHMDENPEFNATNLKM
jgi:ATP-dependent RNA helicase DDX10/DBP4